MQQRPRTATHDNKNNFGTQNFQSPAQSSFQKRRTPFDDTLNDDHQIPPPSNSIFGNVANVFNNLVKTPFGFGKKPEGVSPVPTSIGKAKNPFEKDTKLKSHLNSKMVTPNKSEFHGFSKPQYSYEISEEDEALVNDLIETIEQGQGDVGRNVSLQDNVRKYEENKQNITKGIIEQVKQENLEMSMQPGGFGGGSGDGGLEFEYDVSNLTFLD